MKKISPQELANFTGCFVVRDNGSNLWTVFSRKPVIYEGEWNPSGIMDFVFNVSNYFIKTPQGHTWETIYEPQPGDWRLMNFAPGARNYIEDVDFQHRKKPRMLAPVFPFKSRGVTSNDKDTQAR